MSRSTTRRRLFGIISTFALMLTFGVAVGSGPASATTSVEGNCMVAVTPTATLNDVGGINTTATITWHDECTNVSYYTIEVSTDGGATWTLVATNVITARLLAPPQQDGSYTTGNLPCGSYTFRVTAVHAPGQAVPKVSISLDSNTVVVTVSEDCGGGGGQGDCTQLTGALTLGYYSNKNGQATLTVADGVFLSSLSLRSANGNDTNFDFSTTNGKKAFATWLLNATAKNMSYMLSVQLATLELNIRHGLVDPTDVLCEVPGNPTIGDIVAAAEAFIAAHNIVLGGDPNRVDGDALQTLINEINNNLVTVI